MERRRVRLGDVIDDYCTRCRLVMNHGIVGMVGDDVRKVRCNTCMTEHVYKHGKVPLKKRRENARLFEEVLRGLGRTPDPEEEATDDESPADDAAAAAAPEPETAPEDEAPGVAVEAVEEPAAPPAPEADHGVRRKLYTIRRFSGGKPPAGAEGADTTGGRPPAAHVTGVGRRGGPRGGQHGGGHHGGGHHGGGPRGGGHQGGGHQGGGHQGGGHQGGGQGDGRHQGGRGSGGRSGGRRR